MLAILKDMLEKQFKMRNGRPFLSAQRWTVYRTSILILYAFQYLQLLQCVSCKVECLTRMDSISTDNSQICSYVRSAIVSGLDFTIIGLENQSKEKKTPDMILHYLQNSKEKDGNDIIVFSGGSTIMYANASQVEDAFSKLEKPNTVLFSAEKNCWPGPDCMVASSAATSSFKYLQAGAFIGRREAVVEMLTSWIEVFNLMKKEDQNEQRAIHEYALGKAGVKKAIIELDYNCNIFQNLGQTNVVTDHWAVIDSKGPYIRPDGSLYNAESGTTPLFGRFTEKPFYSIPIEEFAWTKVKERGDFDSRFTEKCKALFVKHPSVAHCRLDHNIKLDCDLVSKPYIPHRASIGVDRNWYPKSIIAYELREDTITGLPVSRGREATLEGDRRYNLSEYRQVLQCSASQPDLHGAGGALALARFIPLTADTIKLTAAFMESDCELWNGCRAKVVDYMLGKYSTHIGNIRALGCHSNTKMFRVMNGSLYVDWPWGMERFPMPMIGQADYNYKIPILDVMRKVVDIPDSVFFVGGEGVILPPNVPVPHISSSPRGRTSSDIPGLWNVPFLMERERNQNRRYTPIFQEHEDKMLARQNEVNQSTLESIHGSRSQKDHIISWEFRIDKAAFFGSMGNNFGMTHPSTARQIVYDMSVDFPEHIDAKYRNCIAGLHGTCTCTYMYM